MFKSIAKISSIIIVLIVLSFILLYWQSNFISNSIKDILNSELDGIAKIEYSELSGNLFEAVNISDILVTLEDSSKIKAKSIQLEYNLASVIFQPYLVREFIVDSLSINLKEKKTIPADEESKPFTINEIPTILDSLIVIDSLLSVFPQLIVNNCIIKNADLNLSKELQFENLNLDLKYAYESEQLDILIESLKGYWINHDLNLKKFQTGISANKNRITLNKLQVETDHSNLYAKSEFTFDETNWIIFDLEDSHIDYLDISKFTEISEISEGLVNTSIQVVGSPNNLSAQLSINGETDKYQIDSLIVDLDFKDNILTVLTGKILINNTFLTFNGNGSVESSYGKINFKKFNVANLVPDVINTSLTGNISFNVDKLDLNHMTGSGEIYLINSSIDSVQIDSLRFALLAEDNNFDIIEPSVLKFGENSLFTVNGNLNRDFIIDAELYTENNELNQLFPALKFDSLNGNFDANLSLSGYIEDPNLRGYLFLPFIEKDSIRLDTIILDLKLNKIFSGRQGDAYFSILKGDLQGFELTEALVNISFDSNKVLFDTLRFANNDNYISLAGVLEQVQDTFNLGLDLFRINYQNYWIENSDSILVNFYPDEFIIDQAQFEAPGEGILEIRGFWEKEIEDMQIGLYVENIKLDPFQQFIKSDQNFGGVLNGEVVLIDPMNNPNIESEVKGELITFNDASLGNVSMDIEYDEGSVYFREFILENGETQFNASGDIALKFIEENGKQTIDFIEGTETNLSVDWDNFDLNEYQQIIKLKNPVIGASSGHIDISGTIKNPKVAVSMKSDSITYDKYNLTNLIFKTHFQNDSIILDTLQSEVNQTFLYAYGSQIIEMDLENLDFNVTNKPLDLNIYSKDDRIEFIGNFMDQIEKITGEYETNIHITGTPKNPVLDSGYFNIDEGNLVLSRVKNPITDLTVNATIKDSVLYIKNLIASSVKEKDLLEQGWSFIVNFFRLFKGDTDPEGQLQGSGTINLTDIQHPEIDLKLNMYEFFVNYFVENTQLVITTENLKITGKDTLNIDADLTIENGKYEVDLDKFRKNIYLASTEINTDRAISWNLEINIPDNFIIASSSLDLVNNFELEISGDLRAIQEPNSPNMELTGHVEILSGNYVAFGQNFEIQQGSIDFSNPKKINPDIEIFAEKESGDYTVELAVNGNLDRLIQDLQIRDANGTYLTNLSLYDKMGYISGSGDAGLVNTGEDVISTSMYTMMERGAQDLTGLDKVKISGSDKLIDLQSGKLNNGLKDASISIGKNLTNNLYLEYRSQFGQGIPTPKLSWEPGNQVSLAYKINKFWSLESAYAQTLKGNTLINISLAWKTTF